MAHEIHNPRNEMHHELEMDAARVAILREGLARGWQLALHGLTHQTTSAEPLTEFADQPAAVQSARMEKGRAILQRCFPSVPVDIFIPPWNTFDHLTVKCAAQLGFQVLCAGDVKPCVNRLGIAVVPSYMGVTQLCRYLRQYSPDDLLRVVGSAYLVVTMHEYEFRPPQRSRPEAEKPADVSLEELAALLKEMVRRGVQAGGMPTNPDPVQFVLCRPRLFNAQQHLLYMPERDNPAHNSLLSSRVRQAGRYAAQHGPGWISDTALLCAWVTSKVLR